MNWCEPFAKPYLFNFPIPINTAINAKIKPSTKSKPKQTGKHGPALI